jgi:2-polyprenyl-3-methyl-5-hydroxy-6-metoxy-1,4-benzoquinol methylase
MDENFYKNYFEFEKSHWWFRVREKLIFYLLKKYSSTNSTTQLKILDFGCGSGILAGKLQNIGYQTVGVDMSKKAINYGKTQGVKNLSFFDGNCLEFQNKSFDFVLALDVLEHIENEKPILTEFVRVLADKGTVIITVPAFMFLWGIQDETSHHYQRYNMSQLTSLVDSVSFEVVRKTYFNTFLFPPIALIRIFSRWLNLKNRQSDFSLNNRLVNRLLYKVFDFERRLLNFFNFPFGVSILLILRKNEKHS